MVPILMRLLARGDLMMMKWLPVIVQTVLDINDSFFSSSSVRKTIFIHHAILVVEENDIEAIIAFAKVCYLKNIN